MGHSSLSLWGRSQGEEWLSMATHSFKWITLACVTHREWSFRELGMEYLSRRSLEITPHFTEGKLRPGLGVGKAAWQDLQQMRHKEGGAWAPLLLLELCLQESGTSMLRSV